MKRNWKLLVAAVVAVGMCVGATGCGGTKSIDDMSEADFNAAAEKLNNAVTTTTTTTQAAAEGTELLDPFEKLTVAFSGTAPSSSIVAISGGDKSVDYTADVMSGVKNGDIVTVTAELKTKYEDKYTLSTTEKEYTVEGLSSYAAKIDEIPADMQEKMKSQAEDSIKAKCASWKDGNTLKDLEFIGYYFLSVKEGFSAKPNNEIDCVYKATASLTGLKRGGDGETEETGEQVYYVAYSYSDILLLPDGVCSVDLSKGTMSSKSFDSDYGYYSWGSAVFYSLDGYADLDSMFNSYVAKNIDKYTYENTVK